MCSGSKDGAGEFERLYICLFPSSLGGINLLRSCPRIKEESQEFLSL